ncbi:MAG: hypothetical protein HN390_09865 [Anaerolineae bacterium]|mgnify:CR=1 FL=1|nr:hypothetical protein [Anaerolineae bacterium]
MKKVHKELIFCFIISFMLERLYSFLNLVFYLFLCSMLLTSSVALPLERIERVQEYTHRIEYDFLSWVADASWIKIQQAALGSPHYIDSSERKEIVLDYFQLVEQVLFAEWELDQIYSDPDISDPERASEDLRERLDALYAKQRELAPFAESVLEAQVSIILAEANLTSGGQPLPQPLYHISPLPTALIISPRETIRQDKNIMLLADFPVDQRNALEENITKDLDFSALVVPVGGVGIYPTMGMRSTNLPWTVDTIAHEWAHNYLTWHPLGWNYDTLPELRTMNETAASIVGGEISEMLLARFYPEYLAAERSPVSLLSLNKPSLDPDEAPFDYRAEMHETRLRADELLAEGKIDEAESYMEERRKFMWENGYPIRKLNQAYFAFYGAYADIPGGAAGTDPVGPAVRALREQSDSLADFVHRIMMLNSFEKLEEMVGGK